MNRQQDLVVTGRSHAALTALGVLILLGLYQQTFAPIGGLAPWTSWEPSR